MYRYILSAAMLLLSLNVSATDAFNCDGWGFTIDGKKATYGPTELVLCSTEGNWIFFSPPGECKKEDKYTLIFDKITYKLQILSPSNPNRPWDSSSSLDCKKIK